MSRQAAKDIALIFALMLLLAIAGGGVWVGLTAVTNRQNIQENRDFIREQCETDLKQDRSLAALVAAAKRNPTLTPEQETVYQHYLDSVEREDCRI